MIHNEITPRALEILDDQIFVTGDWKGGLFFLTNPCQLKEKITFDKMKQISIIRLLKKFKLFMEEFFKKHCDYNIHFNFN